MRDGLPAMALPPKSADDCIPSWASADCSQVPDGLEGTVWGSLASFGRRSSKRQAEGRVARANDRKGRHACDDTRGDPPVVRGRIQRRRHRRPGGTLRARFGSDPPTGERRPRYRAGACRTAGLPAAPGTRQLGHQAGGHGRRSRFPVQHLVADWHRPDGTPLTMGATTAEVVRWQADGIWRYVIDNVWADQGAAR